MHYYALVLIPPEGDAAELVAAAMAPYREGDHADGVREFVDSETEELENYRTGTMERVRTPDGRLLSPWDEEFRIPGTFGTGFGGPEGSTTHRIPPDCERVKIPRRELYASFDEYMREYCGAEARDTETGRFGYWHNRQGIWDFFQIGGRWTGILSGYEPDKDPANSEPCWICEATGKRQDAPRCGAGDLPCNGCSGTGLAQKWPTQWAKHPGDIVACPIALTEAQTPYTLIGAGIFHAKEKWTGEDLIENPEHGDTVRRKAQEHTGRAVVVDYHS